MANKKFKSGLIVFIVIFAVIIGTGVASFFLPESSKPTVNANVSVSQGFGKNITVKKFTKQRKDYIAVLYIEGTIQAAGNTYNQAWIANTIKDLKNDSKNKGIILYIDSPGGTVYESDETYLLLQDYKSSGKKVYAYMGSLAASGGYYIACAAEKIYANRNTLTGSIGVISGSAIDLSEFLEYHGIKYTTVHAGKNKNMGNYNEPFTEEQEAIMQSIADECYDQFTWIVALSRNIPTKELLPLCDGRVYTAKQALNNKLIDRISSWDQAVKDAKKACGDENLSEVVFRYQKQKGLFDSMFEIISLIKGNKTNTPEGIPDAVWDKMNITSPMYLYQ